MKLPGIAFVCAWSLFLAQYSQRTSATASIGTSAVPPPSRLRVEYLENPLSIDVAAPRFSFVVDCGSNWEAAGCERGLRVSGYRVVVTEAASGAPVWDSERVNSSRTAQIVFGGSGGAGQALKANTDYAWTVTWFSADGSTSSSASAAFSTALFGEVDWQGAEWIGSNAQRHLRRQLAVSVNRHVVRARAFVAAPGCHTLRINGAISNDTMGICPWTQFGKRVLYQTHDITSMLSSGENDVEILLGSGMWVHFGATDPSVRALFVVDLDDGSQVVARTAESSDPISDKRCLVLPENEVGAIGCSDSGNIITSIAFASFGTPEGDCTGELGNSSNTFSVNKSCHASASAAAIEDLCLNQSSCTLAPVCHDQTCRIGANSSGDTFPDPCFMVSKTLAVAVECGKSPAIGPTVEDRSWTAARGAFLRDDPFIGTSTDWAVWNNPETQEWTNASAAVQIPEGKLASLSMPLTQVISHRAPVKATALASGNIRFDFAENFVGVTALNTSLLLKAFGLENGSQLVNFTAQHCELVNSSTGAVNCDLTGDAGGPNGQRDNYTAVSANSEPGVQLLPRWTWHGFQFVEVAVSNGFATPSSVAQTNNILDAVTGLELRTNIEQTGSVTFDSVGGTGDHILNDIQTLVLNSQRSNVAAYQPTDCPTREKHGWLGDAQVTAEEAMLNFDMASVYTSFLETIRNNQQTAPSKRKGDVPGVVPTPGLGAGWGSGLEAGPDGITDISWSAAYPLITRWMLQFYGDERVVADHYPNLVRFMDNLHTHAQANSTTEGLPDYFTWGDWCAVENRSLATPGTGPELAGFHFLLGVDAMADMAKVLGKSADVTKWTTMGAALRKIFHARYFNPHTSAYGTDELELQSLTVAPLALEQTGAPVIPSTDRPKLLAALEQDIMTTQRGHLTVGSVGAKHLLPQLSRNGLHDVAMTVATQTTFPSFGYWLKKGATTCWENYSGEIDGSHPPPPTHNHIFLCGGIGEWMYRSVAGIGVFCSTPAIVISYHFVPLVAHTNLSSLLMWKAHPDPLTKACLLLPSLPQLTLPLSLPQPNFLLQRARWKWSGLRLKHFWC
eukprot:INCI4830.2.p1 GENE.INCI4830.2~~INCI4830.2.p1  ORF type:complete len:1072 (-),score=158.19 INCI4830.2:421-3636(-)